MNYDHTVHSERNELVKGNTANIPTFVILANNIFGIKYMQNSFINSSTLDISTYFKIGVILKWILNAICHDQFLLRPFLSAISKLLLNRRFGFKQRKALLLQFASKIIVKFLCEMKNEFVPEILLQFVRLLVVV
jgi:hypothetical protein